MEITEVRIKLMEHSDDRLQAFCSITFDNSFVIRDLKIIEGANGPFVAMPSRKLTAHCHQCGAKNHLRAGYCNHCGARLREERLPRDADGRTKLYADIAHPINSACREMIQKRVITEFQQEQERAKQPGYVSRYDDDYGDYGDFEPDMVAEAESRRAEARSAQPPTAPAAPTILPTSATPPTSASQEPSSASAEATAGSPSAEVVEQRPEGETTSFQPAAREPRPPHTPRTAPTVGVPAVHAPAEQTSAGNSSTEALSDGALPGAAEESRPVSSDEPQERESAGPDAFGAGVFE